MAVLTIKLQESHKELLTFTGILCSPLLLSLHRRRRTALYYATPTFLIIAWAFPLA